MTCTIHPGRLASFRRSSGRVYWRKGGREGRRGREVEWKGRKERGKKGRRGEGREGGSEEGGKGVRYMYMYIVGGKAGKEEGRKE